MVQKSSSKESNDSQVLRSEQVANGKASRLAIQWSLLRKVAAICSDAEKKRDFFMAPSAHLHFVFCP